MFQVVSQQVLMADLQDSPLQILELDQSQVSQLVETLTVRLTSNLFCLVTITLEVLHPVVHS